MTLSALVLLCAGGVGGWLIAEPASPDSLAAPVGVSTVPLTKQTFDDARTVTVSVTTDDGADLLTQAAGVATAVDCEPGAVWESGATPVRIDGRPLMVLATSMPLWRNLKQGDHGRDVAALQTELRRLGVDTSTGGKLSAASWSAVAKFFADEGIAVDDGVLNRADVVWLPAAETTVGSCSIHVGQQVTAGEAIAQAAARLTAVKVDPMPNDLTPGARTLTIGGTIVPVDQSGSVTASDDLAALAGERQVSNALTDPQQARISARLALATPITVYSVPAGAVSGAGDHACIISSIGPVPAEIVSSMLGRTLVAFPDRHAPARAVIDPDRPSTCS